MNETIKTWLINMFDSEIKEARAAIDNENTWADGSPDAETKAMHLANVETNKEYIRELELMKRETEAR